MRVCACVCVCMCVCACVHVCVCECFVCADLDTIMQKTFSGVVSAANFERDTIFEAFLSAQDSLFSEIR